MADVIDVDDDNNNDDDDDDEPIMDTSHPEEKEEKEENVKDKTTTTTITTTNTIVEVGGSITTKAFALLDGIHEDPETGVRERVTIPLTKFPATLGRSHDTDDDDDDDEQHFFGLGKKKALSRQQCRISYRYRDNNNNNDAQGADGRVEWDVNTKELVYRENKHKNKNKNNHSHNILDDYGHELPPRGFFVIECLGKNRILVNQNQVYQGHTAVLEQGTPIRISSYMLYFLLPTDATPKVHTLESNSSSSSSRANPKKRPLASSSSSSSTSSATKKTKTINPTTTTMTAGASYQAELDALPVETLLKRMTEAIDNDQWERRHQLIGSTIALKAVRDSGMDPDIQSLALGGGVSRSEIMSWIETTSDKYSEWVQQMHTKMEARSYQAAVTKSLLKAGFTRTGTSGRYVKWLLPDDIPILKNNSKKKNKSKKKSSSTPKKAKKQPEIQEETNEEEQVEEKGGEEQDEKEEGGEEGEDGENDDEEEEESDKDDAIEKASGDGGDSEEESGSELEKGGVSAEGEEEEEEEEEENTSPNKSEVINIDI